MRINYKIVGPPESEPWLQMERYIRSLDPFQGGRQYLHLSKVDEWVVFYYRHLHPKKRFNRKAKKMSEAVWHWTPDRADKTATRRVNYNCKCLVSQLPKGALVVLQDSEEYGPMVYCGESSHSKVYDHMVKVMPLVESSSAPKSVHITCDQVYLPHPAPWPFTQEFDAAMTAAHRSQRPQEGEDGA